MQKSLLLFLLISLMCSCASYRAFESDTSRPAWTRINKSEQKGLAIAAEDYSDPKKAIKYFDCDLRNEGYLPIYLCLGNREDYEFTVERQNIIFRYENGTEAQSVKVEDVIAQARSSPAKALLALPLIIPVFFIWDSISQANFELDKDYTNKAFHDSYIKKDDELYGFVFFKIPEGQEKTPVKDARVELKVIKKAKGAEMAETLEYIVSISPD